MHGKAVLGVIVGLVAAAPAQASRFEDFIGSSTSYRVSDGVRSLDFRLVGAPGGGEQGGRGGVVTGTLAVRPGERLEVLVGGPGGLSEGGANGGGAGVGQGGGGATELRRGTERLAVAGGGGGAGSGSGAPGGAGGDAGASGGAGQFGASITSITIHTGTSCDFTGFCFTTPTFSSFTSTVVGGAGGAGGGAPGPAGGDGGGTTNSGGGGGGGARGGAGGAAGNDPAAGSSGSSSGGGGGGGGTSMAPAGGTTAVAAAGETPLAMLTIEPTPPAVTISTPTEGQVIEQGTSVAAAFTCQNASAGCADQAGRPSGAVLDTSTPGEFALTVRAVSDREDIARKTVRYVVRAPDPPPTTTDTMATTTTATATETAGATASGGATAPGADGVPTTPAPAAATAGATASGGATAPGGTTASRRLQLGLGTASIVDNGGKLRGRSCASRMAATFRVRPSAPASMSFVARVGRRRVASVRRRVPAATKLIVLCLDPRAQRLARRGGRLRPLKTQLTITATSASAEPVTTTAPVRFTVRRPERRRR